MTHKHLGAILIVAIVSLSSMPATGEVGNRKALSDTEVVLEGVMRMYLLSNTDVEYARRIDHYRTVDGNSSIAFVLESNEAVDVTGYIDPWEREFIGRDASCQKAFMVVPTFPCSGKEFAGKYVNRRVRVKGTLYVPGGGWRNATVVVMSMRAIEQVERD